MRIQLRQFFLVSVTALFCTIGFSSTLTDAGQDVSLQTGDPFRAGVASGSEPMTKIPLLLAKANNDTKDVTGKGKDDHKDVTGKGKDDHKDDAGKGKDEHKDDAGKGKDEHKDDAGKGKDDHKDHDGKDNDDHEDHDGKDNDDHEDHDCKGKDDYKDHHGKDNDHDKCSKHYVYVCELIKKGKFKTIKLSEKVALKKIAKHPDRYKLGRCEDVISPK